MHAYDKLVAIDLYRNEVAFVNFYVTSNVSYCTFLKTYCFFYPAMPF